MKYCMSPDYQECVALAKKKNPLPLALQERRKKREEEEDEVTEVTLLLQRYSDAVEDVKRAARKVGLTAQEITEKA